MPMRSWACEWVCVILDYSPLYWIQTGYIETYTWIIFPIVYFDFYLEVMDDNGHYLSQWGIPLVHHTYTYAIWYDSSASHWYYYIAEGSRVINWASVTVVHYAPVDLQAMVETISKQTNIGGSHFSKISYSPGSGWFYWNRHSDYAYYPPYYLYEVSHYEFFAYGGSL